MSNLMLMTLFGGIFLLLYGINLAGEGLKNAAGPHIKTALQTLTGNRFVALVTGIVITFLMQSSSATSVLLVGLANSGLITLRQSIGVILGSNVGTTITVQLVSFKVYDYAPFICGIGLALMFLGSSRVRKSLGEGILGFGLVFLSIGLMSETMSPLKDSDLFKQILLGVKYNPVMGVLLSAVFTAIIHSSAAVVGIALSFSFQGLIPLDAAIPIIIGANIGTCFTALVSSLRAELTARRVAWAHMIFNIAGAIIILPLLSPFTMLVQLTSDDISHQIANAHTFFNVITTVVFIPFSSLLAQLLEKWIPEKVETQDKFSPKFLNANMLKDTEFALGLAMREAMRMADSVQEMLKLSLPALISGDEELIKKIENMDDKVDALDMAIRMYLIQLGQQSMSESESQRQHEILNLANNLEHIGDVIVDNQMEIAKKRLNLGHQFSKDGRDEIEQLHQMVFENLQQSIIACESRDFMMAQRVIRNKQKVRQIEHDFYNNHLKRLEKGVVCTLDTSSMHVDILNNLKRINSYITGISYPVASHYDKGN